jgi:ABC-type uncharacterized transport system permease subunit
MRMLISLTMFNNLTIFTALAYLASAGFIVTSLFTGKLPSKQRTFVLISAFVALLAHTLLISHSYSVNHALANDFFNMLSLVFLVISALFFFAAVTQPVETLAIIVFPFTSIAVLLNIGNAFPATPPVVFNGALQTHIILSILSYSLLTVAAFQAIMLSFQEKQLHNRQTGKLINSLPPLQLMENLLFQVLSLGVFLLTFALATGFIFLDDIFAQHLVHKTVLSILAWLLFATLLWGRHFLGWRGQKAVKWTYGAYFALMLAYFGSKFVLQLLLS